MTDGVTENMLSVTGENTMEKQFREFLISAGYAETTPGGHPSTVYDYVKRVNKVCEWESCTWEQLAERIDILVQDYDVGGKKEALGNKSHRAVINALRRYQDFTR